MFPSNFSITHFLRLLKKGCPIKVSEDGGNFLPLNTFQKALAWFGFQNYPWTSVSKAFRKILWDLESSPVYFEDLEAKSLQLQDYDAYLESISLILKNLRSETDPRSIEEQQLLERERIALLYRLEKFNGGLSPDGTVSSISDELLKKALVWKSSTIVFSSSKLTKFDLDVLLEASCYVEFKKLLLQSKELLCGFLNWSLRDKLPVNVFVEYPAIESKINRYHLSGRIGSIDGALLKVIKTPCPEEFCGLQKKIVTLPFEGKEISILNDHRSFIFRGKYALTIADVYAEFEKKELGESNLEFFREGFVNWNAFRWGYWNDKDKSFCLVNIHDPDWWKHLPVYKELTLKQARTVFGPHLDGTQWNFAMVATRELANLDFQGAHAYGSLAVPNGKGHYTVYEFGKYSMKFPQNLLSALLNIGHTSAATVVYPDENAFYTHRQRSLYSFGVSESQGLAYLEEVRRDMLKARSGNFVYQIESENCARWAYEKIEAVVGAHRLPNVFQMAFLKSEPRGFMQKVFEYIKSLPSLWQIRITLLVHFFLGAYKGVWIFQSGKRVWKSLIYHPFWKDTVIYHPSMLHRQQEIGMIGSFVRQGVTFNRDYISASYHDLYHKMVLFSSSLTADLVCRGGRSMVRLGWLLNRLKGILFSFGGTIVSKFPQAFKDQLVARVTS